MTRTARLPHGLEPMTREELEMQADVIGPHSAAAAALADAEAHGGPVRFWLAGGLYVLVEKLPAPARASRERE